MSLITELKRRNVFRVSIAYAVAAWLLLQLTEVLIQLLGLPEIIGKAVVALLVIGFPVALILAWAFELTPDGIKREHEVDRSQSITPATGKKLNNTILVMMALAIAYLLFDKFSASSPAPVPANEVASEAAPQETEPEGLALGIAVLPFANMSTNADNEFFAGGVHEEVLTHLSRIADLRVISRTSMLRIAETDLDVRAIGARLGVSHVLEGSVRRSNDRVRVTVQLIDAETDEHLWAENYDRTLTDIFAIQSDIALAIAGQLKTELSPEVVASIEEVPTQNADAYDLYLQAIKEKSVWRGVDTFNAMIPLLERAITIDQDFLQAKVMLVEAYGRLLWLGEDPDRIYSAKALDLVESIRRRWPDRIEGHIAQGHYYYTVKRNYQQALTEYRIAEAVFPNDPQVMLGISSSLKRLDRPEAFLDYAQRLYKLDPENSSVAGEYTIALSANHRFEDALAIIEKSLEQFPNDESWESSLAYSRLRYLGDVDGFLAFGERLRAQGRWNEIGSDLTWLLYDRGDIATALEHLDARMSDEYRWNDVYTDTTRALILQADKRDDEARIFSTRALDFVTGWIESGQPFPSEITRNWYMDSAYVAAVAGNAEAVSRYRALAAAQPKVEAQFEGNIRETDAHITALLGDPEGGWAILGLKLEDNRRNSPAYYKVSPYYQRLYGDVPGFQSFIAQAE
jgi:TolB-like protein/Flp pilus assembly protein TadD